MRVLMIVTAAVSYWINAAIAKARFADAATFNFETPLTTLVWITSIVSIGVTYLMSYLLIPSLAGDNTMWWKLSTIITCGTLAGAIIPELGKVFTSTESRHVREIVTASREGGPSLNILAGLIAGDFSAYWMGITIVILMGIAAAISSLFPLGIMIAPAVFAFGLVAFGFLGMGPVTIAVDSYGPVTDNAQSVFELSTIETLPGIVEEINRDFGFRPSFESAKGFLERASPECPFKATAEAGAHRHGGRRRDDDDLLDHRAADERPDHGHGQALASPSAIPSRTHYGRRGHLLVHRRFHAGSFDGCLSRR